MKKALEVKNTELDTITLYEIMKSEGAVTSQVQFATLVLGATETFVTSSRDKLPLATAWSAYWFLHNAGPNVFRNEQTYFQVKRLLLMHLDRLAHRRHVYGVERAKIFQTRQVEEVKRRKERQLLAQEMDTELQAILALTEVKTNVDGDNNED